VGWPIGSKHAPPGEGTGWAALGFRDPMRLATKREPHLCACRSFKDAKTQRRGLAPSSPSPRCAGPPASQPAGQAASKHPSRRTGVKRVLRIVPARRHDDAKTQRHSFTAVSHPPCAKPSTPWGTGTRRQRNSGRLHHQSAPRASPPLVGLEPQASGCSPSAAARGGRGRLNVIHTREMYLCTLPKRTTRHPAVESLLVATRIHTQCRLCCRHSRETPPTSRWIRGHPSTLGAV